ncbi:MAG: hypothetical protein H6818_04810 [Phycisphaerales bacterium]|nr:hypothetical protein [Phycisphaerales bacterium]
MTATISVHTDPLVRIERLIEAGEYADALESLRAGKSDSAAMRNARGVVLMRLGRAEEAVSLFRSLTTNDTGLFLKKDAPIIFKTNYATALLLNGNVTGALVVLKEINDETHPGVVRLRTAIARWRKTLSLPRRVWMCLAGGSPEKPIALDWVPGELAPIVRRKS